MEQLAVGPLVMVSLVLQQWDVLGSEYYLIQLLFYNYRLWLNKDQGIKVFHLVLAAYSITAGGIG